MRGSSIGSIRSPWTPRETSTPAKWKTANGFRNSSPQSDAKRALVAQTLVVRVANHQSVCISARAKIKTSQAEVCAEKGTVASIWTGRLLSATPDRSHDRREILRLLSGRELTLSRCEGCAYELRAVLVLLQSCSTEYDSLNLALRQRQMISMGVGLSVDMCRRSRGLFNVFIAS